MASRPTIQLTIRKIEHSYAFSYTDSGSTPLLLKVSTLDRSQRPLPEWSKLVRAYENWTYAYQKEWQSRNPSHRMESEGEGDNGEFVVGLKHAEITLAERFREWLQQPKLNPLWETMRRTVSLVSTKALPVEVLLDCEFDPNDPEDILHQLPWQRFHVDAAQICLVRTVVPQSTDNANSSVSSSRSHLRRGVKVLHIIAHDERDPDTQEQLLAHRTSLESMEKLSDVTVISLTPENYKNPKALRDAFWERLAEGPDILIFSGHGAQNAKTHGEIHFGNGVKIHFAEHEHKFQKAIDDGLQVAIFISCHTYHFARSLVRIGLRHAIAMRDKIHVEAGGIFLKQLCECLSQYASLQRAMDHACDHLSQQEDHPSAHLIPSRFRYPQADPFQLEPSAFNRWWRTWQPTCRESLALSSVLILSMVVPLQLRLYNGRTAIQAMVRDVSAPVWRLIGSTPKFLPPVLVVAVDQESVNEARNRVDEFSDFQVKPMHRGYLAKLVSQLTQARAKVVGIDYFLSDSSPHDSELIQALSTSNYPTQFVLAQIEKQVQQRPLYQKLKMLNSVLPGEASIIPWEVALPEEKLADVGADRLPFAYLLVLLQHLSLPEGKNFNANNSKATSQISLRQKLNQALQSDSTQLQGLSDLKSLDSSLVSRLLGIQNWLDLSLSPNQVYDQVSAKDLQSKLRDQKFRDQLAKQAVILIPGGYYEQDEADLESVPLAVRYWCSLHPVFVKKEAQAPDAKDPYCSSDQFPVGTFHAYMTYQIQGRHFIYALHSFWFILLAPVAARWANIKLANTSRDRQRFWIQSILLGYLVYVLTALFLYLAPGIVLPIALPSLLFGLNLFPTIRPLLISQRTYAETPCAENTSSKADQT